MVMWAPSKLQQARMRQAQQQCGSCRLAGIRLQQCVMSALPPGSGVIKDFAASSWTGWAWCSDKVQSRCSNGLAVCQPPKGTNDCCCLGHSGAELHQSILRPVSSFTCRIFAFTKLNAHSSRSHCIVMLTVIKRHKAPTELAEHVQRVKIGKLFLVDLAGSERLKRSGSTGAPSPPARLSKNHRQQISHATLLCPGTLAANCMILTVSCATWWVLQCHMTEQVLAAA